MIIIISVLITVVIILTLLFFFGVFGKNKNKNKNSNSDKIISEPCKPTYISPKTFETGFVKDSPQHSTSICYGNDNAIRYPINLPYVKYGLPDIPDNCQCTEFIQAP